MKENLSKAFLSGIYISLAGLCYLTIGGPFGACLFGAGLLGVIATDSLLYTGRIYEEKNYKTLGIVLFGNILGCSVAGVLSGLSYPEIVPEAAKIITARIEDTFISILWRSIGCGLLMTSAVLGMKKSNPWPLLLGIPLFILSGLYHSVADGFYFFVSPDVRYLPIWVLVVLGNLIGGKLLWIKK